MAKVLHGQALQKAYDRYSVGSKFTHLTNQQLIDKSKISFPTKEGISLRLSNPSLYVTIHRFLIDHYPKNNECDICKDRTKDKYEHALKKGRDYSYNISDYMVLCVSCHKNYDNNDFRNNKISEARKREVKDGRCYIANLFKGKIGKDHNTSIPIARVDIVTGEVLEKYDSLACAERKHGFKSSGICNAIAGRIKSSYGFKWIKLNSAEQP